MIKLLPLVLLPLAILACIAPSTLAALPVPSPTVAPTPTAIATLEQTFTVTAWAVYIRDESGNATGQYLSHGDTVQCEPKGDYCILSDMTRIWAGCLDPNPEGRGCKKR